MVTPPDVRYLTPPAGTSGGAGAAGGARRAASALAAITVGGPSTAGRRPRGAGRDATISPPPSRPTRRLWALLVAMCAAFADIGVRTAVVQTSSGRPFVALGEQQ